jgi:Mg2+ and Co2+ transporter CorA
MNHRSITTIAYIIGVASMLAGLFCVNVTLAGKDYRSMLRWATGFAIVSALSFAMVAVRGSTRWRIFALASALPLVFVIAEVVRRG